MPITKIEVRKSHTPEEVAALIDAVYQAQIEALNVPKDDKRNLYQGIVRRFGALGIAPSDSLSY